MKVMDHGFVECQEVMGDAKTVVNCARVSFGKQIDTMEQRDIKLIEYLIRHKHYSPFRHVMFRFHIKAPEFVMRQWYKHVIGANWASDGGFHDHAWNEISGRYVEYEDIHVPDQWRLQAKDKKQGSDGEVDEIWKQSLHEQYVACITNTVKLYHDLVEQGIAKEQARILLPVSLYTETIWTCSFQAVMNFLQLRLDEHAQYEIRQYAYAIQDIVKEKTPILYQCWLDNHTV